MTQKRFPLTPQEVAKLLRVTTRTLTQWRSEEIGPPFFYLTRKGKGKASVRYWQSDVLRYTKELRSGAVSVEETRRLRQENKALTEALNVLNERINQVIDTRKEQLEEDYADIKQKRRRLGRDKKKLQKERELWREEQALRLEEIEHQQQRNLQVLEDERARFEETKDRFQQNALEYVQEYASKIIPENHVYDIQLGVLVLDQNKKPVPTTVKLNQIKPTRVPQRFTMLYKGEEVPIVRVLTIFNDSSMLKNITQAVMHSIVDPSSSVTPVYKPKWSIVCSNGFSQPKDLVRNRQELWKIHQTNSVRKAPRQSKK